MGLCTVGSTQMLHRDLFYRRSQQVCYPGLGAPPCSRPGFAVEVVARGEGFSEPCAEGQVLQRVGLTSHPWLEGELGCRWNGPHLTSLSCFLPALPAASWGVCGPPVGVSQRPHLDLFLKPAWKTFREDFIFASELLPDTDNIFWENAGPH